MTNKPVTAPEGAIWVCRQCGKTSRRIDGSGSSNGWDVSCSINAVLVWEDETLVLDENGKVVEAQPYTLERSDDEKSN